MIVIQAKERGCDKWGCGHFGASRGNRSHNGTDFLSEYGDTILSTVAGEVTKIGYPYSDDLSYRYVQITNRDGLDFRYFYIQPSVELGQRVALLDPVGTTQNLQGRYNDIKNHVHIEIKKGNLFLDPEQFFHRIIL